jgi:hypothetical protein
MAIPSYLSNVLDKNVNTFGDWFERTNNLSSDMGSKVLSAETTVSGGTTTGNTSLVGIFSASVVAVGTSLRGGTVTTPAALSIISAASFTANTNFTALETISNHTSNSITANTFVLSTDVITATSQSFSLTSDSTTLTTVNDLTLSATNILLNGNLSSTDGILDLISVVRLEVDDSSDAVRITQTGTGNAFVVEDSFTPDTNPFVITSLGRVGIHNPSPSSELDVVGDVEISGSLSIGGTVITSTAGELNILDGVTATSAELNILDGVTATSAELNILDGVTATAAELNILDGVTSTTAELNLFAGVTATAAELNILDGVTATAAELNSLDGVTATFTDLNRTQGVTANIQSQLDSKSPKISPNFTGTPLAPTAALGTNTTQIATASFVQAAIADIDIGVLNAALSFGAVGTYAFLVRTGTGGVVAGNTYAGSTLLNSGVNGTASTTTLNTTIAGTSTGLARGDAYNTGTWRAMGSVTLSTASDYNRATLFLRIS